MATPTTTTSPETPVHVKISIVGKDETRKFKISPKDLGPAVLPGKLRSLLQIPDEKETVFERYSDSSSAFITLDSANPSIYKQLQRAAKAKGKLRLRVNVKSDASTQKEEPSKTESLPERLKSSRYVRPYVSDATGQDASAPSRLSTATTIKVNVEKASGTATATAPSTVKSDAAAPSSGTHTVPKKHFWPVTDSPLWSDATKAVFDKTTKQNTQESLRKIKEAIAARAIHPTAVSASVDNDEAPVPRFFSARDHCRAEHIVSEQSKSFPRGHNDPLKACTSFTICCNNCDAAIPNAHWHCSICDEGDYDLCEDCIQKGILCDNDQHWLIKRVVEKGKVVNSTTERIAPKKLEKADFEKEVPGAFAKVESTEADWSRTCNSCVQVYPESHFVTCTGCEDYDLCIPCLVGQKHGHHPAHSFAPATAETVLTTTAKGLLGHGRNHCHFAICDGCDRDIQGTRHKCLQCPDWDYCNDCHKAAQALHPGHRFVPIYEDIAHVNEVPEVHDGIFCDGPLCVGKVEAIHGDRYKCAVCHDTDFCARCEANPCLAHNRTHPLLKFKTPVRNVMVSTYGGKDDGSPLIAMGDQPQTSSKATETVAPAPSANAATQVQTVAEIQPQDAAPKDTTTTAESSRSADAPAELNAHFVHDTVPDGTVMSHGAQFTQTWTLKNPGPHSWPAGCAVCFIGGDGMLDVDPYQPSHINHLRKATRSNSLEHEVAKDEVVQFTVTMRVPDRDGKAISYWRLKGPDGIPFGHKLWCDINVEAEETNTTVPQSEEVEVEVPVKEEENEHEQEHQSQLIFPKLDKESLSASISEAEAAPVAPNASEAEPPLDDVESLALDDDANSSDEEYELIESGYEIEEARNGKK